MDRGTKALAVVALLGLAGCTKDPGPLTYNEYQIALTKVRDETLADCEPLGPPPENRMSALAQDQADIAAVGGCYKTRYQALRDYVRPLVEKAKQESK